MPIPKRESGEDKDKYVSRCISSIIDEYGQEQAAAICYTKAEENMSKSEDNEVSEVFVLKPKKNENRGIYLSRCLSNSRMKSQIPNRVERGNFCLNAFNSYYKYWAKLEDFSDVPEDSALGECIAYERAKGDVDYKTAYSRCATRSVSPNAPIVLSDEIIIEPVL